MLCSQGTVGATKAGANMVAAAPAATAAVARWERVVGMARKTEALGGYYVMEQNAATRKETSCQNTTHMSMSIISFNMPQQCIKY